MDRRGIRLQGNQLRPVSDATTVSVRGGEVLIADGPFAETKEQIAGYDIIDCADLDEAIEVASKHPVAHVREDRGEAVLGGLSPDIGEAVAEAFREEWGRVVAALIGMTGDWDLAEECAQDAFAQAMKTWPRDGVPRRPGAWLTTVARNRALDRLRRGATETARLRRRPPCPFPAIPIQATTAASPTTGSG